MLTSNCVPRKQIKIRVANEHQIEAMRELICRSARGLGIGFYSARQIESAIEYVYGVDSALIADGTYFGMFVGVQLAGCGGWSQRQSLYGGDQRPAGTMPRLRPGLDAARIRAFFIDPAFARQGIATLLYQHCAAEAKIAGYHRLELAATLPGVPFYKSLGFVADRETEERLPDGVCLKFILMSRDIS